MKSVADDINFMIKYRCLNQVVDTLCTHHVVKEVSAGVHGEISERTGDIKTFIVLALGRYIWDFDNEKA